MESLPVREARLLALTRAGLIARGRRPAGSNRRSCHAWLRALRYVQLDAVNIAGVRSHTLVLLSRIEGLRPEVADELLRPGAPLFEYWGHEASWLHIDLYPVLAFRREDYRRAHPWWGPLLREHRAEARAILRRISEEGPLRSADFEDRSPRNDWGFTLTKRLLHALWSAGDIAVKQRPGFHRLYDVSERVIPDAVREKSVPRAEAIAGLLLEALAMHGWAEPRTLARQWRLSARETREALRDLEARGAVVAVRLVGNSGSRPTGWIRPGDLDLAAREGAGIDTDESDGVLLSPFDTLLWDRARVQTLFGFDQVLEIYKPKARRKYGYFCLPVLAGGRLVARCDLKADRDRGLLRVLSCREEPGVKRLAREASRRAVTRLAEALRLTVDPPSPPGG